MVVLVGIRIIIVNQSLLNTRYYMYYYVVVRRMECVRKAQVNTDESAAKL